MLPAARLSALGPSGQITTAPIDAINITPRVPGRSVLALRLFGSVHEARATITSATSLCGHALSGASRSVPGLLRRQDGLGRVGELVVSIGNGFAFAVAITADWPKVLRSATRTERVG
jgi:hypothetical protein